MTRRTLILTVLLMTAFAGVAHACPMCKDSIPNSDVSGAVSVPSGFNMSVYCMLGGFLSLLALISGMIYKGVSDTNLYNASQTRNLQQRSTTPVTNSDDADTTQK
ncbi:hypothetical protein BH10PLA1_BH10PLA1_07100 [soil metagenome]